MTRILVKRKCLILHNYCEMICCFLNSNPGGGGGSALKFNILLEGFVLKLFPSFVFGIKKLVIPFRKF